MLQPASLYFLCGCVVGITLLTRSDIALIAQLNSCRPKHTHTHAHTLSLSLTHTHAQLHLGFATPAYILCVLAFQSEIQINLLEDLVHKVEIQD